MSRVFPGLFLSPASPGTDTVTPRGGLAAWRQDSPAQDHTRVMLLGPVSQTDHIPGAGVTSVQGRSECPRAGSWAQPAPPRRGH